MKYSDIKIGMKVRVVTVNMSPARLRSIGWLRRTGVVVGVKHIQERRGRRVIVEYPGMRSGYYSPKELEQEPE